MISRERWVLWGPAAAVAVIGTALGLMQSPPAAAIFWDKAAHSGSYFVLGLLLLRATHRGFAPPRLRPATLAVLLATAHGVAIELIQAIVPWREASVADALADAVGGVAAALGLTLWYALRRRAPR